MLLRKTQALAFVLFLVIVSTYAGPLLFIYKSSAQTTSADLVINCRGTIYPSFMSTSPSNSNGSIIYLGVGVGPWILDSPSRTPEYWINASKYMSSQCNVPNKPFLGIGAGGFQSGTNKCVLFTARDSRDPSDPNISYGSDRLSELLALADTQGVDVFLGAEVGNADPSNVIDILAIRAEGHPCVVGFMLDWEWITGIPDPAPQLETWYNKVKSHGSQYKLFVVSWKEEVFGSFRAPDLVFLYDGQGFSGLGDMHSSLSDWSSYFNPYDIGDYWGYDSDKDFQDDHTIEYIQDKIAEIPRMKYIMIWTENYFDEITSHSTSTSSSSSTSIATQFSRTYGGAFNGRELFGGWRMSATNTRCHNKSPAYWSKSALVLGGSNNLNLYIFGVNNLGVQHPFGIYCNVGFDLSSFTSAWKYSHPYIATTRSGDMNEEFLNYFDEEGIKVLLQVEPGMASVDQLIDLLLERYGDHESVVGFAIDLEFKRVPFSPSEYAARFTGGLSAYTTWYNTMNDDALNSVNTHASDDGWEETSCSLATALRWLDKIQSHIPDGTLLLKRHFNAAIFEDGYDKSKLAEKGEYIIICNDNQNIDNINRLANEANGFNEKYNGTPCILAHQVGYDSDSWEFENYDVENTHDFEDALLELIPGLQYILWVDENLAMNMHDALQSQ